MLRFASYPIARAFTSIVVGLCLLAPLYAADAPATALKGRDTLIFEDAQGDILSLTVFKGKPVIVNLWASWCEPCVEEMPSLAWLQKEYKDRGLVVLALSEDDSLEAAEHFYKTHNITGLTTYLDKDHTMLKALEVRGLPTSILMNDDGFSTRRIEGPIDWQSPDIIKAINELINPSTKAKKT